MVRIRCKRELGLVKALFLDAPNPHGQHNTLLVPAVGPQGCCECDGQHGKSVVDSTRVTRHVSRSRLD